MEFERVRLQSVVRSLRTTDGKRTLSTSVMRAFAPPEKTLRRGLSLLTSCLMFCRAGVRTDNIRNNDWKCVQRDAMRNR